MAVIQLIPSTGVLGSERTSPCLHLSLEAHLGARAEGLIPGLYLAESCYIHPISHVKIHENDIVLLRYI